MSRFTKFRDKVTGAVESVVNTGLGVAGSVLGAGLGGLTGLLQGSPLPMQSGQMGQFQSSGQFGGEQNYQQNLEGLMNMIGQQPTVQPTGTSNSGLI